LPSTSANGRGVEGFIDFARLQSLPTAGFFLSASYKTFPPMVISIL